MSGPITSSLVKRHWHSAPAVYVDRFRYEALRRTLTKMKSSYRFERVACPLCGEHEVEELIDRDMYGFPVRVGLCLRCAFIYNYERMDEASFLDFYNSDYRAIDRGREDNQAVADFFEFQRRKGERIHATIKSLTSLPWKSVLEIGCGAGGMLDYFRSLGVHVSGCDHGAAYLAYGQSRGLALHVGDLGALDMDRMPPPRLVIYEQVFEHLLDPKAELTLLRQKMAPHDLLYIGVPGFFNIDQHYAGDIFRYFQLPHVAHFTLNSLTALLAREGFQKIAGNQTIEAIFMKQAGPGPWQPPDTDRQEDIHRYVAYCRTVHAKNCTLGFFYNRIKQRVRLILYRWRLWR